MPRGDGTGPMGYGPKNSGGGGFGRGAGRCRGFGWKRDLGLQEKSGCFIGQPNPEGEQYCLDAQRNTLQNQLNEINRRIDALTAKET
jgi:hypothetical protein